ATARSMSRTGISNQFNAFFIGQAPGVATCGAAPPSTRSTLGRCDDSLLSVMSGAGSEVDRGESSGDARELDRLLRARRDALAAGLAGRGARRVGRLSAVGEALQLREDAEPGEVGVVHAAHLEHVERASVHAFGFAFARGARDDGGELSGLGAAVV